MGTRRYIDFDLEIEQAEHGYRARVINSPVGQAATEFELPLSDMEVENFILKLNRPRRGVRRIESQQMEAAKELGGILYSSVFQGEVSSSLQSSLVEADKNQVGLRIRLRLSDAPELLDLPWEYLYNRSLNRFLSLSVDSPLVRYLDMPGHIPPLEVKPPLRVLVMISSPQDVPTLDTEEEWRKLKESVADLEARGLMVLDRLEAPTLGSLQHALRREDYHIFHFIGHGGFDEYNQDGILLLEDEYQRSRQVSGQDLGIILHDEKTLRLAVLNSCEGGRTSRTDPFVGVGQSLLQQGIPAVIAMQFEISDEAAIKMSHEFYYALADGYPVDAALGEARKGIFAEVNDVEWGTPVLYLRSSDGRIFDVDKKATIAPPRTEPGPSRVTPAVAGAIGGASAGMEPVGVAVSRTAMPQPVDTGYAATAAEPMAAAAIPAAPPKPVSTGQARTAGTAPATAAPAAQPAGEKGKSGSRTKLWLGLGVLLAILIIGGGIFLFGGLGGNLPKELVGGSVGSLVAGAADETVTAMATHTPTSEPTIAPTDEPIEPAVVAAGVLTTTNETVEPTLEPTDLPEPTDTVPPTATPTALPTDTPQPTATRTPIPTHTPAPTATPTQQPTDTPQPTAIPTQAPTSTPQPEATPTSVPTAALAGKIAYSVGGTLYVVDVKTKEPLFTVSDMRQPNFRGDGAELLADGLANPATVVTINAKTGAIIREQTEFTDDYHPFWSPDGTRFTFDSKHHGLGEITMLYTQALTSRKPNEPITLHSDEQQIRGHSTVWTDDDLIAFTGCDYWPGGTGGSTCGIYVMPSWSGRPTLSRSGNADMRATDNHGGQLVFMSQETGNWEVFVMPNRGGEARNLSQSPGSQDGLGTFSPDGKKVAFVSNRGGGWAIWVVNLNGSGMDKLLDLPGQPTGPPWYDDTISWGP